MGVFPILAHHPDQPRRLMGRNHFPEPSPGPRDCCVCSKRPNHRKSSSYQCNTCKASLCLHLCMHVRTMLIIQLLTHYNLRTQALTLQGYVHKLSHTTRQLTQALTLQGYLHKLSHYKAKCLSHNTSLRIHKSSSLEYPEVVVYKRERERHSFCT